MRAERRNQREIMDQIVRYIPRYPNQYMASINIINEWSCKRRCNSMNEWKDLIIMLENHIFVGKRYRDMPEWMKRIMEILMNEKDETILSTI